MAGQHDYEAALFEISGDADLPLILQWEHISPLSSGLLVALSVFTDTVLVIEEP